jgi:hypothetical protein
MGWPLGMRNEVLKNGNGIEVMRVDFQFFHFLSIRPFAVARYRSLSLNMSWN